MCDKHNAAKLNLRIPADLAHPGEPYWKLVGVDECISDLVSALQRGGIDMRGSCCGHGRSPGSILLQDGRELIVEEVC